MKRVIVNFGMQNAQSHDLASRLLDYVERFNLTYFVHIIGRAGDCIEVDGTSVASFDEIVSRVEEKL
ncbi:MAG: hypothetical protein KAG61_00685 [Bacteriovoracaceae bacterium]|nr:hypothetical protein [Bacteriovoracaceae bacterium]